MLRKIFNVSRRYFRSDASSILPVMALFLPIIIGFAGAGVDISHWLMTKRHLQAAADAGALAGAWEIANGGSELDAKDAALKEAINNGYDPAKSGTLTTTVTTSGGISTVKTDIQERVDLWFSSIFIDKTVYAATSASASTGAAGGGYCFLSLNTVNATGNTLIDAPDCGVAANSTSPSSLQLTGNVTADVGDVHLSGGYKGTGNIHFTYDSLTQNASLTQDPYAGLDVEPYTHCSQSQQKSGPVKYTGNGTKNLTPGVFCGGLEFTGNLKINLAPGTYVMDGGDFSGSGNLTISGTGVTIVLTNSGGSSWGTYGNLNVSGNISTYLQAPPTGPYAGIAVYQDRNAPASGSGNVMIGNTATQLDGVFYSPARSVQYGGNIGWTSTTCSKIIAKGITFNGNPKLGNDCQGKGTKDIGPPSAKLVL